MCAHIEEEAAWVYLRSFVFCKEGSGKHFNSSRKEVNSFGGHFNSLTLTAILREDECTWIVIAEREESSHQAME